jgi:Methyltransferase domain
MLERARERLAGVSNSSFHIQNGQALSFQDQTFDAFICNMALMYFPDSQQGVEFYAFFGRMAGRPSPYSMDRERYMGSLDEYVRGIESGAVSAGAEYLAIDAETREAVCAELHDLLEESKGEAVQVTVPAMFATEVRRTDRQATVAASLAGQERSRSRRMRRSLLVGKSFDHEGTGLRGLQAHCIQFLDSRQAIPGFEIFLAIERDDGKAGWWCGAVNGNRLCGPDDKAPSDGLGRLRFGGSDCFHERVGIADLVDLNHSINRRLALGLHAKNGCCTKGRTRDQRQNEPVTRIHFDVLPRSDDAV